MFIEVNIIQSLPPSNPNRGEDGGPKSITFGGTLRARMSSQSQKRAARLWYRENAAFDRDQLAQRSRRHAPELAKLLDWLEAPEDRQTVAQLLLALFNVAPEKLLEEAISDKGKNLLFVSNHELKTIALIASQHQDLLADLLVKAKEYQGRSEDSSKQQAKKEAKETNFGPSKRELAPLRKALVQALATVPGDVALFGRMMASLTETSVDGCVQVADAISVNGFGIKKTPIGPSTNKSYVIGEVDFYSAVDDIAPNDDPESDDAGGTGMIGELPVISPVYYRYANVCIPELESLVGNPELAKEFAAAFLQGFIRALPSGYIRSHAHMTLPEFVLVRVSPGQPYQHAPAFQVGIDRSESGRSIAELATVALLNRVKAMDNLYGATALYSGVTAMVDVDGMAVSPLANVLDQALAVAFGG